VFLGQRGGLCVMVNPTAQVERAMSVISPVETGQPPMS
jgi:hypothetical protein